jgi:formamidopyrimidine-DNA glycosylase
MFELPEFVILAQQTNDSINGLTFQRGQLGNSPHKFVWYNRSHAEFERLSKGKKVGQAWSRGKWLFLPLEPGYILLLGEYGGKNLHNNRGRYIRIMDKNAVGRPCPECGGEIVKIQYLGGACYFCPKCQDL